MSKDPIRKDKTCLNCNHVVDLRFCPNCGQENTNTRKTFHHLFIHFFEDLTHYENAFWKTIRNLLFKPSSLTKEYLSGKRLSYLAPVRLYIFISFVTFFLIAVFPNDVGEDNPKSEKVKQEEKEARKRKADSIIAAHPVLKNADDVEVDYNWGYDSIAEMDSIRKVNPNKIDDFTYWMNTKMIPLNDKYTDKEIKEKLLEKAEANFPKTLFLYMPLFAFVLWLFHSKKRWYYFDHGIFTLHYFSFILLLVLILFLFNKLMSLLGDSFLVNMIDVWVNIIGYTWMVYYFLPAHHRFYGETRMVSLVKSIFIYFINAALFSIILVLFIFYTFINIH